MIVSAWAPVRGTWGASKVSACAMLQCCTTVVLIVTYCIAASLMCKSRTLVVMGVLVQKSSMMCVGCVEGTGVHAH